MHLWLILLFILSLADWHEAWQVAMFGLCCALCIELVAGCTTFGLQSTSFLEALQLKWPGDITPALPGASVVQLADGSRILRAYGTLPHLNILGGLVLITLLGPAGLFINGKKTNYPAFILLTLGILLLILTFSRSAWLGLAAFIVVLGLKARHFERRKLILLFSVTLLSVLCDFYVQRDLVGTRSIDQSVATEKISTAGRLWLDDQALKMIESSPVAGVGIGSFILKLAETAVEGAPIEPVHNLFLLLTAELRLAGMILLVCICVSIARQISESRSPQAILAGALVTGLGVIGLFDHYLWTLARTRDRG